MRHHIKNVAIFLVAIVCGLGAGYFIGLGGVPSRRAMEAASACDCQKTVASLEPQMRSDGLARHRYIPETRVGPHRPGAIRVVGVGWRVTTGDISEQRVDTSENMVRYYERESHMRLIVGYNEARGEVIYSDSWGEGHAHKRMDAQDALSITTGMYYLAD